MKKKITDRKRDGIPVIIFPCITKSDISNRATPHIKLTASGKVILGKVLK